MAADTLNRHAALRKGLGKTRRLVMTRIVAPTALVIVFVAVFALGIMPKAQAGERGECSNASLRGSFGFTTYVPSAVAERMLPFALSVVVA